MGRGLEDPAAIPSFSLSYIFVQRSNKNICVIQANKYLQLVCIYVPSKNLEYAFAMWFINLFHFLNQLY